MTTRRRVFDDAPPGDMLAWPVDPECAEQRSLYPDWLCHRPEGHSGLHATLVHLDLGFVEETGGFRPDRWEFEEWKT